MPRRSSVVVHRVPSSSGSSFRPFSAKFLTSRMPRIPGGELLLKTTVCPAHGLRLTPLNRSITWGSLRSFTRFRVFSLSCGVSPSLYSPTTPRLFRIYRIKAILILRLLNAVAQAILCLCKVIRVCLLPQFIPGRMNVLVDSLKWRLQVLGSEWTLCHPAFQELLRRWPATIDLFTTGLNHRLPVYFSPMLDYSPLARTPLYSPGTGSRRTHSHCSVCCIVSWQRSGN